MGPGSRRICRVAALIMGLVISVPAAAQQQPEPDRSDPAIIERELDEPEPPRQPKPRPAIDAPPGQAGTAAAGAQDVVAGAIRVSGATRLPAAAFASAIEPFLGRPLDQQDLVALATAVATVARRSGYGLATAWVPAQELAAGVLVVELEEGRIDAVRATGPGAALIEQRLAAIVGGQPVRTADLERQLMIAGDVTGLWVGEARLVREGDRSILTVVTRYNRFLGRAVVDNWGSETIGPIRAYAEVDINGVAIAGDTLRVGISTTPLNPREFHLVEGRYRLPFGGRGTTLAVGGYYGRTDADPDQNTSGFQGDSWQVDVEAMHPLTRSRARSLWVGGRFEVRDSALDRRGARVRDDRIASASLFIYGFDHLLGGRVRVRASLVQGLNLLGATGIGDPLASRLDAGGVFTKFEGWADYRRKLGSGFSTALAVRAQGTDGPLLSSEEMGLGGPQFLRAFDYRELSGDEGAAASAELRFDLKKVGQKVDYIQFYGYADGGRVTNFGPRGRGGILASAGGGLRLGFFKNWDAGLEVGLPLTDGAADADPDPRISFSLRTRF